MDFLFFLYVEPRQPSRTKRINRLLEFTRANATVDLGILLFGDAAGGMVLHHQIDIGFWTEFAADPVHDFQGSGHTAGHYQVAQENTAQRHTLLIGDERTDLPVHLLDGTACRFGVIRSFRIAAGILGIPELEIRHVDVHYAVHESKGIQRVVGAGVVDQRQTQAVLHCTQERFQNLRHHVFRSHQVDVVAALFLQAQHHAGRLFRFGGTASSQPANFVVLAEDAAQVAPAEEDRSRTTAAAQALFLAEVGKMAADDRVTSGPADFRLVLDAVHVAVAWAKDAVGQLLQAKRDATHQFPGLPQLEICGLEIPSIDGSGMLQHLSSRGAGRLLRSPFAFNPGALYVAAV